MRTSRKLLAVVSAVALGTIGLSSPAWAGGAPTPCETTSSTGAPNGGTGHNFGGDCTIAGSISITSAIQLATNETAFSLSSSALNTPSPTFQIQIASNVPTGYYVSEWGPAGGFTSPGAPTPLPDSAVAFWSLDGSNTDLASCAAAASAGGYNPLVDPNTAGTTDNGEYVVASGGVSGPLNCATGFTGYTVPTGDDSFDLHGYELTTSNGETTGTYTGNVMIAAWGN